MPPPNRSCFHNRLSEPRTLLAEHQNDKDCLEVLCDELGHRSRPAALALRRNVQQRLREIDGGKFLLPNQGLNRNCRFQLSKLEKALFWRVLRSRRHIIGRLHLDDRLKPPLRLTRIEPLGVPGRPSKYVRNPKMDVALDLRESMPRSARYAVALGALISDMHRQRQSARQITLEDGVQIPLDRGHFGYSFVFTEDADLFEDARVELRIGARRIEGNILSISGDQ